MRDLIFLKRFSSTSFTHVRTGRLGSDQGLSTKSRSGTDGGGEGQLPGLASHHLCSCARHSMRGLPVWHATVQ